MKSKSSFLFFKILFNIIVLSMTQEMVFFLQLFLPQRFMNLSCLKPVVCPQQWVKHELRPILPLQKQRLYYIRHEHLKKKEPHITPPHKTK
jgi:hypothetical protein